MGFKFNKGKSWKKLGKKSGGKSKDFFTKDDGKSDWFKKGGAKTGEWFEDKDGSKKNFFADIGNGSKKTWNAASSGIGKGLGGMGDTMNQIILAAVVVGGVVLLSSTGSSSTKTE